MFSIKKIFQQSLSNILCHWGYYCVLITYTSNKDVFEKHLIAIKFILPKYKILRNPIDHMICYILYYGSFKISFECSVKITEGSYVL